MEDKPRHSRGLFGKRDRRRHARNLSRPLEVWFGDQRYFSLDWSRSGVCINPRRIVVQRGDLVTGYAGHLSEARLGRFTAVVARVGQNGEIGMRFLKRGPGELLRPAI